MFHDGQGSMQKRRQCQIQAEQLYIVLLTHVSEIRKNEHAIGNHKRG